MSERWTPTGRLRWVVRYPVGSPPVTLAEVVERRMLQQEWTTLTVDGWRYEWRDVPMVEEAVT